jgi:hypothetical protein
VGWLDAIFETGPAAGDHRSHATGDPPRQRASGKPSSVQQSPVVEIGLSFVFDVISDTDAAAIARTIIAPGRPPELAVIADGVETEARRDWLAMNGRHA